MRLFFVNSWSVSRVLFLASEAPAIYLSLLSPTGFIGPPSGIGRAALIAPVYMTFQLPRNTALMSPPGWWALTPPSHPYLRGGGYFLLLYSTLADCFPLRSGMLCVARTFLLHPEDARGKPTNCFYI